MKMEVGRLRKSMKMWFGGAFRDLETVWGVLGSTLRFLLSKLAPLWGRRTLQSRPRAPKSRPRQAKSCPRADQDAQEQPRTRRGLAQEAQDSPRACQEPTKMPRSSPGHDFGASWGGFWDPGPPQDTPKTINIDQKSIKTRSQDARTKPKTKPRRKPYPRLPKM